VKCRCWRAEHWLSSSPDRRMEASKVKADSPAIQLRSR
jgi:hypothetical protein